MRWQEAADPAPGAARQDGAFRFEAVRPGDYYAIALDYVQTWQAVDPSFLEPLMKRALRVRVVDGKNEPLRLAVQR